MHIFEGKFKFVARKKTVKTPLLLKVYKIKIAHFFTLYMGYILSVFLILLVLHKVPYKNL